MTLIMNLQWNCIQDLQQENSTLLTIRTMANMRKEAKMTQLSNLKLKSLNQIFAIIQMHIFL